MAKNPGTALTVQQRAAVALKTADLEKTLIALAGDSKAITTITNKDGYAECHAARMRLKNERVGLEKEGKDARDDATKFSKAVIAEENRLIALILPEEKRLQAIQDEWDAIEEQKRQAEAERITALQARVEGITAIPASMVGQHSDKIVDAMDGVRAVNVSEFAEFAQFAQEAKDKALAILQQLHAGALAQEQEAAAEAKRVADERAELARLREAQAKRELEEAGKIEDERRRCAQEEAASRAKIEAEEKASRERIAEEERKAKAMRDAEESLLAKERAQREEAQAKEDARLKAQRDELEAKQREVQRQADELLSGAEMLRMFIDRFGRRKEFEQVVSAIRVYLQAQPKQRKAA